MNACAMVSACLRHQCPELLDPERTAPADGVVPPGLRYGAEETVPSSQVIAEEPMGRPDVVAL